MTDSSKKLLSPTPKILFSLYLLPPFDSFISVVATNTLFLSMQNSLSFTVYFALHFSPVPSLRSLHAWTDKSCFAKAGMCVQKASYHYRMKNIWHLKRLSICCQCVPKFFSVHWRIHKRQLMGEAVHLDFMGFTPEILIWVNNSLIENREVIAVSFAVICQWLPSVFKCFL